MVIVLVVLVVAMVLLMLGINGERHRKDHERDAGDRGECTQSPDSCSSSQALSGQVGAALQGLAVEHARDHSPERKCKAERSKAAREPPQNVQDPSNLHPLFVLPIQRDRGERWGKRATRFIYECRVALVWHGSYGLLRCQRLRLNVCDIDLWW